MKKVIREGVFETNSSSTHSVVFKRKENDKPDDDSSYEIHTPFGKTMFLIGLIEYNRPSCDMNANELEYVNLKELYGEGWFEEMGDGFYTDSDLTVCEKFKEAVINEYIELSGITYEDFEKQFNESNFSCDGKCLCCNFFENDVLDWCNCPFDSFSGIRKSLNLYNLNSNDDYRAKAKEYLSSEFKFALKEFYCGVMQIGNGEIF